MIDGFIQAHATNYTKGRSAKILYPVLHYTANDGDTAENNCRYFAGANRNASAHFFVDEHSIWRSVRDEDTAWHVGAAKYKHPDCRNRNSIGIELCSRKDARGNYYLKPETVANAVRLVRALMDKYNVPVSRVLRHYDVTGKICPAPWVQDETQWRAFLRALEEEDEMTYYKTVSEIPYDEGKAVVQKLVDREVIKGADADNLNLSDDMVRMLIFNDRAGLYGGTV